MSLQDQRLVQRFEKLLGTSGEVPQQTLPVLDDPQAQVAAGMVVLVEPRRAQGHPILPNPVVKIAAGGTNHPLEGDGSESPSNAPTNLRFRTTMTSLCATSPESYWSCLEVILPENSEFV